MQNFTRQLLTEWRKLELPFGGETIIVAISGGADSVGLALALNDLKVGKKLNLRFVLAHFNHNLRGDQSDADEEFVKDFAQKFDFELVIGKGEISKNENLEQSARKARYDFLTEKAENLKAFAVLTAHTLNDQAETFLINLIRGSGLEGLGAMKSFRALKGEKEKTISGKSKDDQSENDFLESGVPPDLFSFLPVSSFPLLVRPLMTWAKRIDTENFCRLNEIEYRYDSMNEDLAFRRVRIRKVLLPLLEDFNPKIMENLAQTAFILQNDLRSLENFRKESRKVFETQINSELILKNLTELDESARNDLVRHWLKNKRGNLRSLDAKHFEAIERLMFSRKSGRKVELPNGAMIVKREGKLFFEERKVEK